MTTAGGRHLWQWRDPARPDPLVRLRSGSTLRVDAAGNLVNVPLPPYPPATVEASARHWQACFGPIPEEQCASVMEPYQDRDLADPDWLVACLAANAAENCDLFQYFRPTCWASTRHPLPKGRTARSTARSSSASAPCGDQRADDPRSSSISRRGRGSPTSRWVASRCRATAPPRR
ncbi:MAG: hypothetical protein R3F43_13675 [bacterium]